MKKYIFIITAIILLIADVQARNEVVIPTLNAKRNYLCVSFSSQRDGCRREISGFDDGDTLTIPVYSPRNKHLQMTFYTDIDSLVCKMDDYADFKFNLKIAELKNPNEICVHFTNQLPNKISNVEKIYALSMIWNEVRYNFAFYDELDFDFDSLYRTYIPTVLETSNDIEFYNALERFMATLKDGHTHTVSNYGAYIGRLPLDFKVFQQELYVTGVYKSDGGTIPLGSKVLKINNIPYKQYVEREVLPYIIAENPYRIENEIVYHICSSKLISDSLSFTVQLPDKQIRTYNKHFYAQLQDEGEHLKSRKTDRWTPMNLSWLKDSIAVLTINTFNPFNKSYPALLDSLLEAASVARKLIIDLRSNGGGTTEMSYPILQRLCKQDSFLSLAAQTRINNGAGKANGNWMEEYEDFYLMKAYETDSAEWIAFDSDIKRYQMPVVILVSENTASAAEDFLIMLYEWENRPVIIGRPTLGSTGSPLVVSLPEDGYARICTRRCLFPYSMRPFNYIQPDIEITYTFEEYVNGKDKELEKALEVLEAKR